jgi:hypothetical protein
VTLQYEGPAFCLGCAVPVYVYRDLPGQREVVRDCGPYRTRHLCAEPTLREGVVLDDRPSARCPECGTRAVRWSTWGRLVEWCDSMLTHEWLEPLEAHVCDRPLVRQLARPRSLPDAEIGYQVWTTDGRVA